MSFDHVRVMSAAVRTDKPSELGLALGRVAGFIDNPIADVSITPEADTAAPRSIVFQARDRLNEPWKARFLVLVCVSSAEWSGADTSFVLSVSPGTLLVQLNDALLLVQTDADGSFTLDISTPATVYLSASVIGMLQTTGAISIT